MAITKVTTPVTGFESPVDIGLKIPVGTNSNVPTGAEGMIRNDTEEVSGGTDSTTAITFYNGTAWKYFNSTVSQDSTPLENFNTVLYTGDGSTSGQSITTVGFQPDLVWIKTRNQNTRHILTDSVRGVNSQLFSNETFDERNYLEFTSFDDYGFTVKRDLGTDYLNQSGINYVAWCYKAGGLKNKSADFNGSSSYVDTTFTWPGSTTLSFSTWFKTDTINVSHYIVGDFNLTPSTSDRRFIVKIAVNNILQVSSSGGESSASTFQVTNMSSYVNKWTHLAVTVSGTNIKVYLNGTQSGSTFTTGTPLAAGTQPFCIGSYSRGAGKQNFYGNISQTRFFTDVLTDAEVTQLYNETAANNSVLDYPTGTNCITAYPLGENADSLNSAYNGTASYVTFDLPGYLTRNNNGTIESTVSANDALGFSIVNYTGVGVSSQTIGHGLDAAPEMIIVKSISQTDSWWTWHKDLTSIDYYVRLNEVTAETSFTTNNGIFGGTLPTSTVFSVGYDFSSNGSGNQLISYCFTSKPGLSKVGSYVGNGGNKFVSLDFQPSFVMWKGRNNGGSWEMFDNKRTGTKKLWANLDNAEGTGNYLTFDSNPTGFTVLGPSGGGNTLNYTYLFIAFA